MTGLSFDTYDWSGGTEAMLRRSTSTVVPACAEAVELLATLDTVVVRSMV